VAGGHLEQPRFQRHPSKRTYPKRSPFKRNLPQAHLPQTQLPQTQPALHTQPSLQTSSPRRRGSRFLRSATSCLADPMDSRLRGNDGARSVAGGHLEQPHFQRHPFKRTYPKHSPLKRSPLSIRKPSLQTSSPRRRGSSSSRRAPHVLQTPWIPVFAGMTERGAWREVTSNSRVSIGIPSKRTYSKHNSLKNNSLKRSPLSIRNPRSKRHPREGGDPAFCAAPHASARPMDSRLRENDGARGAATWCLAGSCLFHRNRLRQIPRLVHVRPFDQRYVVAEQLQWDGVKNR